MHDGWFIWIIAFAGRVAESSRAAAAGDQAMCHYPGGTDTATTAAPYEVEKQEIIKQWAQVADAFSTSEAYNNSRFRQTLDAKQLKNGKVSLSLSTSISFSVLCSEF